MILLLLQEYVVATTARESDAWDRVVQVLAEAHPGARVLRFSADKPDALREPLRKASPHTVCVVLRKEELDVLFARRFLLLATAVDDDPFVDFAYGFITGADAAEALAFAKNSILRTEPDERHESLVTPANAVFFGDPARRPFAENPDRLRVAAKKGELDVTVRYEPDEAYQEIYSCYHYYGGDAEKEFRLRIPLSGDGRIRDVRVIESIVAIARILWGQDGQTLLCTLLFRGDEEPVIRLVEREGLKVRLGVSPP